MYTSQSQSRLLWMAECENQILQLLKNTQLEDCGQTLWSQLCACRFESDRHQLPLTTSLKREFLAASLSLALTICRLGNLVDAISASLKIMKMSSTKMLVPSMMRMAHNECFCKIFCTISKQPTEGTLAVKHQSCYVTYREKKILLLSLLLLQNFLIALLPKPCQMCLMPNLPARSP